MEPGEDIRHSKTRRLCDPVLGEDDTGSLKHLEFCRELESGEVEWVLSVGQRVGVLAVEDCDDTLVVVGDGSEGLVRQVERSSSRAAVRAPIDDFDVDVVGTLPASGSVAVDSKVPAAVGAAVPDVGSSVTARCHYVARRELACVEPVARTRCSDHNHTSRNSEKLIVFMAPLAALRTQR